MFNKYPKIERSPLSSDVTGNGITVRVEIIRLKGCTLEVVYHTGASTVRDNLFATDNDAFAEFVKTVETEGIGRFSSAPPQ